MNACALFLAGTLTFVSASPGAAQQDPAAFIETAIEACSHCSEAAALAPASEDHVVLEHDFDVRHYRLELHPDLEEGTLHAHVEIKAVSERDDLADIALNFVGGWQLDAVTLDGVPVEHTHDGMVLTLYPAELLDKGRRFVVGVTYNGVPVRDPEHFAHPFPIEPASAYTISQPFQARQWFPCFDEPSDKAEDGVDLLVTTPPGFTAAANGTLISRTEQNNSVTYHWRHQAPIATYLIALAVDTYSVIRDKAGDVPLQVFVRPEGLDMAETDFSSHGDMLQHFGDLFGEYPFESYGAMVVPARGWAMEHQTMSTFSETLLTGDRRYEGVVAHELAHQWWGDSVTPADYRDIWLNEGFATYSSILWLEHLSGASARDEGIRSLEETYRQDDRLDRHSLYRTDYNLRRMFSRTVYRKGALVLHMLRWQLGDTAFFDGLREYHRRFRYSTVATPDFIAVMEEVSGEDLQAFFNGWVYGTAWPVFALHYRDEQTASGPVRHLTVQQVQDHGTTFAIDLPVDPDGAGPMQPVRLPVDGTWTTMSLRGVQADSVPALVDSGWILMDAGTSALAPPTFESIEVKKFKTGRKGKLVISGNGFTPVTSLQVLGDGVSIRKIRFRKNGTIIVRLLHDGEKTPPRLTVIVMNPDGQSASRFVRL